MTIAQVNTAFPAATQGTASRFFLPGAQEFAGSLNLGQILKGKVLRQYEGNRYLVNFDGQERVVDSAVPLRTGELLHGRVIALGERVEMQRVQSEAEKAAIPDSTTLGVRDVAMTRHQAELESALDRYQAKLSEADRATLLRSLRAAEDASAMARVGVFLNKLGLNQSPVLLETLYARLKGEVNLSSMRNEWLTPPRLESVGPASTVGQAAVAQTASVRQLADVISRAVGVDVESSEEKSSDSAMAPTRQSSADAENNTVRGVGFDPDRDEGDVMNRLTQWVLNAQTGGSVMHRLGTLPLLLGGRLVEVDVALFEQRRDQVQKPQAQHRQLVFTLQTEHLGKVEVIARVVGDRVRVSIATSDGANTAFAAAHTENLKAALSQAGWVTDEVSYETRTQDERTGVVSSVVEHVISLDSMNRLI